MGRAYTPEMALLALAFAASLSFAAPPPAPPADPTPDQVRAYFGSAAYKRAQRSNSEFLLDLYRVALRRDPDPGGFSDWLKALAKKKRPLTRPKAIEGFLASAEYAGLHGLPGPKPGTGGGPKTEPTLTPPVDKARNPGNGVFDGAGAFVASAAECRPSRCGAVTGEAMKAAGMTWIALQVHNSDEVGANTVTLPGWADEWRKLGFKVGFWGVSYGKGKAAEDGRTAARLTAKYGGEFYIADCEGPFQMGEGDIAENRAFVSAFQGEATARGIGGVPRALSSMGRVALDMRPWLENGWDTLPQAYWNDYQVYQPSLCVAFYHKESEPSWPMSRIHPTIATYGKSSGGDQTRAISLTDYAADLQTSGTRGWSFYLPEHYLDGAQLKRVTELKGRGF